MTYTDFRDLVVFKRSFDLSMKIFYLTKNFPKEEKYSLTDQIRRSSRSVCANLAEAYRKRRYRAHFISKLSDCDSENSETLVWLLFSKECGYIDIEMFHELSGLSYEVGKLLTFMMTNPEKFD